MTSRFRRALLRTPYPPLEPGMVLTVLQTGAGMTVWHPETRFLAQATPLTWENFDRPLDLPPLPSELPNYLFWYYVPGFAYHGHHLYLDDWWLNRVHSWDQESRGFEYVGPTLKKLREVVDLCGRKPGEFPFPQAFCEWFAGHYPTGIFYNKLVADHRGGLYNPLVSFGDGFPP